MAHFKKTVATAKAKVAKGESEAFAARLQAIEEILQGAALQDVMALCARVLAEVAASWCEAHQDEFKAELLRMLSECVAIREEQDAAEAAAGDDVHPQVH